MSKKEIRFTPEKDGIISYPGFGPWGLGGIGIEIIFDQTGDALKAVEAMTPEERLIILSKIEPIRQRLLELIGSES